MEMKLVRISEIAKGKPKERFTAYIILHIFKNHSVLIIIKN